jgi:hypothetical protein
MLLLHIQKYWKSLQDHNLILSRSQNSFRLNSNKVLLVGMVESPHFQKWLGVLKQEFPEKKILIFPTDRPRFNKSNSILQGKKSIRIFKSDLHYRYKYRVHEILDIKKDKFDIIDEISDIFIDDIETTEHKNRTVRRFKNGFIG